MRACSNLARFVGVPWVSGGRDPARGCDCWGVIVAAARECYGLDLPDYRGYTDADEIEQTAKFFAFRSDWEAVAPLAEQPGDVIVLTLGGTPAHAGLVVACGLMLHSLKGRDACVERYRSLAWASRVEGIYRWFPR